MPQTHYHLDLCPDTTSCDLIAPGQHGEDTDVGDGWQQCEHPDSDSLMAHEDHQESAALPGRAPVSAVQHPPNSVDLGSVRLEDGIQIVLWPVGHSANDRIFLLQEGLQGKLKFGRGRGGDLKTIWNGTATEYRFRVRIENSTAKTILLQAANDQFLTVQRVPSQEVTASVDEATAKSEGLGVFTVVDLHSADPQGRPAMALRGKHGNFLAPDAGAATLKDHADDVKGVARFLVGVVAVPQAAGTKP